VTAALVLGLVAAPTNAQAGWLSDIWNNFTDTVENVFDNVQDTVENVVEEVVLEPLEDTVIFLLRQGAGKGADYLIGLMLQLEGLDGHIVFDLLIELIENEDIITDDILVEMIYNKNMVSLIAKTINAADTQEERLERAARFFAVSAERFMPILTEGRISIDVERIPLQAIVMFSDLGTVGSTTDGLEKSWEDLLRMTMGDPENANALMDLLMGLKPEHQKAMLEYMFLSKIGDGAEHTAQSVNFNQAMIEGFASMMESAPQDAMALFSRMMPMMANFDASGNMTGMTPYGMRFFTVLATKAMTCDDPSALALMNGLSGMLPMGTVLPAVTDTEVCGRVESADAIALINSGAVHYYDSDGDGVPDFMDRYPGVDNSADMDGDGIPDGADNDMDGDGIANDADADVNGDGIVDNGPDADGDGINDAFNPDTDGDGIIDSLDDDIDGDLIPNDEDADVDGDGVVDNGMDTDGDGINDAHDPDIDGDGIANDADADVNGDGAIDNGPDTDGDGINDANDTDMDGDGIPNGSDDDMDGDGIANDADADVNGDGIVDNGSDTDGDGINDTNDPDIDGDGIANGNDADADGDGEVDDGKTDSDGDGIDDASDADADGDGQIDDGNSDVDGDGVNDDDDTGDSIVTETIIYHYTAEGVLIDEESIEVINRDYSDADNHITNVVVLMPGNKSVVIQVDMDGISTDDEGNKMIISDVLDNKGSRFIISMTRDGFGKVFIGNEEGGFEMSGYLQGMKENEELVFSVKEADDGELIGKTVILPKDKALTFGSSTF
jgi:hypothetical protein